MPMKTAKKLQLEIQELRAEIQLKNTQIKKQSDYITNLESALKDLTSLK